MWKLKALDVFIDAISKETSTGTEFIRINYDPANKSIMTQNIFYSTKINDEKFKIIYQNLLDIDRWFKWFVFKKKNQMF